MLQILKYEFNWIHILFKLFNPVNTIICVSGLEGVCVCVGGVMDVE